MDRSQSKPLATIQQRSTAEGIPHSNAETLHDLLLYRHKRIMVSQRGVSILVPLSDILYIEADGNYTRIILRDKTNHHTSKTVKYWERKIAHPFFVRCHSSYLVNTTAITSVQKGSSTIALGIIELPMSRSRREELIKCLH